MPKPADFPEDHFWFSESCEANAHDACEDGDDCECACHD